MTYQDISGRFMTVNTAYDENMINNRNSISKIGRSAINGSMIKDLVATRIRTLRTGARIDISGNDIALYDDTTGGGGVITGDTARILFTRTDGNKGNVIIQKRVSKNDDSGNVLEITYEEAPTSEKNYIFIGRRGNDESSSDTSTNVLSIHGKELFQAGTDKHFATNFPEINIYSNVYGGTTNFDDGASRMLLLAANEDNSTGWRIDGGGETVSGQTGGGVAIGASYPTGASISQIVDVNGTWFYNNAYPGIDSMFSIGSSSFKFTTAHFSTSVNVNGRTFVPVIGSFNTGKYYLREA